MLTGDGYDLAAVKVCRWPVVLKPQARFRCLQCSMYVDLVDCLRSPDHNRHFDFAEAVNSPAV
jgi:hypothetical protein